MRLRTAIELLGYVSVTVSDESMLDQDVLVCAPPSGAGMAEGVLRLCAYDARNGHAAVGAHNAHGGPEATGERQALQTDVGVLIAYVEASSVEGGLPMPPPGVVIVAGEVPFERYREDFGRLSDVQALLSYQRNKMYQAFLSSYDIRQFTGMASALLKNPILVTNTDRRLLAYAGEIPEDRPDVRGVVESGYVTDSIESDLEEDGIIRDVRQRRHAVVTIDPTHGNRWAHSIVYCHHMELGRFDVLEVDTPITALDLELIDYAGSLVGVMIERLGVAGSEVGSSSSALVDLISGGFVNELTMRAQVSLTQLPLDESYVMVVIVGRGGGHDYYARAGRRVSANVRRCLWAVHQGKLVVLVPVGNSTSAGFDDYDRAKRIIMRNRRLQELLDNNDMRAFVSEPFAQLEITSVRFAQCLRLEDATSEWEGPRCRFFWEERFRVIAHGAKTFSDMDDMLDKRVVAMALYDRTHGSEFFETAIMSVRYPGSPAEAALALNVHRNTYFYRVNKVRELFLLDLKDGDDRLAVSFTSKVMEGLGDTLLVAADEFPDAWRSVMH